MGYVARMGNKFIPHYDWKASRKETFSETQMQMVG
jgi:hypothetical protein